MTFLTSVRVIPEMPTLESSLLTLSTLFGLMMAVISFIVINYNKTFLMSTQSVNI